MIPTWWYDKTDLLTQARARGFTVTKETIKEWVEQGLLGESQREWPGHGSVAKWPQEQLDLFLLLLEHRQRERDKVRLGHLCNVPVWRWLYWGELGGVSLKQVRRAMGTWVKFRKNIPEAKFRWDVTNLVELTQGPRAREKRTLIKELTEVGALQKDVDRESLRWHLDPVVNAYAKGEGPGSVKAIFSSSEYMTTMMPIRLRALRNYLELERLPDVLWEWARTLLLVTVIQWQTMQPSFAADPEWGHRYPRITVNTLCESSCYYLLTILGIAQQQEFAPGVEDYLLYLNPESWCRGEATSTITTRIVYAPLLMPDGKHVPYLRNDIIVTYKGEPYRFSLDLSFI